MLVVDIVKSVLVSFFLFFLFFLFILDDDCRASELLVRLSSSQRGGNWAFGRKFGNFVVIYINRINKYLHIYLHNIGDRKLFLFLENCNSYAEANELINQLYNSALNNITL